MRKTHLWIAAAIALALAASGTHAATTFWLTTDPAGAAMGGDTVTVASGTSVTLYCYMDSSDVGNTFEAMVGYDTSDATTYGAGKDTNNGAAKKLTLGSSQPEVVASIDSFFDVFATAGFAGSQVVLDASGREEVNADLGGRPYGLVVRAAKSANVAPGTKQLFSFALTNSMPEGQSQNVVVSNYQGANSFSSAWKYGTVLAEDTYTLTVLSGAGSEKPVVGANNKAILDSIMATATGNYSFVFWGTVQNRTAAGFDIDDGSGVIIQVEGDNSVSDGDYVSVKGTLDVAQQKITSPQITTY